MLRKSGGDFSPSSLWSDTVLSAQLRVSGSGEPGETIVGRRFSGAADTLVRIDRRKGGPGMTGELRKVV